MRLRNFVLAALVGMGVLLSSSNANANLFGRSKSNNCYAPSYSSCYTPCYYYNPCYTYTPVYVVYENQTGAQPKFNKEFTDYKDAEKHLKDVLKDNGYIAYTYVFSVYENQKGAPPMLKKQFTDRKDAVKYLKEDLKDKGYIVP